PWRRWPRRGRGARATPSRPDTRERGAARRPRGRRRAPDWPGGARRTPGSTPGTVRRRRRSPRSTAAPSARPRSSGLDRPAALGAEAGAPEDGGAALAPHGRPHAAARDGCGYERVQLREPVLERQELAAALEQELPAELVAAEHLQHQPAEIAEPVFARPEQVTPLAAQAADGRQSATNSARGRRRRGLLARATKARQVRHRRDSSRCQTPRSVSDTERRCGCSPRIARLPKPATHRLARTSPTMPTGIPTQGTMKRKTMPTMRRAIPTPIMASVYPVRQR